MSGLTIVNLDTGPRLDREDDRRKLENVSSPENLAYIMYTSGSTGRPKGVMVEHRNVVGFLYSYRTVVGVSERRIGTCVCTFSFDTSVEEIFSCLCFGGTVHLVKPETSIDAPVFARYLVDNGINTSYILPDFLEDLANALIPLRDRLVLKCLLTGLSPKKERSLQLWRELKPDLRIINAYGPTEVTYGATAYDFIRAEDPDGDVPIGVPFPNYRVYIVDRLFQPVPIGVAGELVIGGVGVVRGYLNLPGETADKFVSDPFSGRENARLYRTGDMARFRSDGTIEFLGRLDEQVKIRGYRIEPGEIRTILDDCAGIRQSAVMVREDQPGEKRIVAYLVPETAGNVSVTGLRRELQEKLPAYMIPAAFVTLAEIPHMPNGKVDYQVLPEPDSGRDDSEAAYETPRTDLEKQITAIWQEALGLDRVSIHDNFFDLGGHSLLAMRVISCIRDRLNVDVPLLFMFSSPTPAQLTVAVAEHISDKPSLEQKGAIT
jgi:amino acid adenylation domain-containing protein